MAKPKRYIVAITGASGALYAKRLIEALHAAGAEIFLIVSPYGRRLLHDELGMETVDPAALAGAPDHNITLLPYKDVGASIASGSFKTDGMVVVPCSNNKLAELAHGLGDNLISRAAQVTLKERRRLIIVHREMPLGLIEIKNMLELAQAGAILCPANPGFYTLPQSIDDIVNFVVARILDLLEVEHRLAPRWSEDCVPGDSSGTAEG
ncbi:MAG TPA: flavin prenyltransferase UbiX [Phycisphaerae bacterium]|nr:flavin prenyltransferase UbiX [Phycisphaerae bacterium]